MLYIRGADEHGLKIGKYLDGLRAAGVRNVRGKLIANCGHFTADEQPRELARAVREFMNSAA